MLPLQFSGRKSMLECYTVVKMRGWSEAALSTLEEGSKQESSKFSNPLSVSRSPDMC
jgi:hypothetical protein